MERYIDALVLLLLLQFESKCMAEFSTPSHVALKEGSPTDFIFESDNKKPIEECRFTVPGFATPIKIFSGLKNDKYEFVGDGFSKGQCGLRLLSVNRINAGIVKCSLVLSDNTEQERETNVTVLYPIEKLNILSNSKDGLYEYKENETMEFKCTAEGGYPEPTLTLSIGGKEITGVITKSEQEVKLIGKEPAQAEHHNQIVLCRAEQKHSQPDWSNTTDDTRKLTVFFSPRLENRENSVDVPVVLGQDATVTVRILSNPEPSSYELTKNGSPVDTTLEEAKKGRSITEYTWVMLKVSKEDTDGDWKLIVENNINKISIPIHLIPVPPTDEGLGGGAIAGIVFAVLVLITATVGGGFLWFKRQ